MLIVSRRSEESILIQPAADADMNLRLKDVFADGPIEIIFLGSSARRVKLGIEAPNQLTIRRKA